MPQQVIDQIVNKKLDLADIENRILPYMKGIGLKVHTTWTVGLPGETPAQAAEPQVQFIPENWEVSALRAYCDAVFRSPLQFTTVGGEKLELHRQIKSIDKPDGSLGSGGVQVGYVASGQPDGFRGPCVTIWTSEKENFDVAPYFQDLLEQAKEIYRKRGQIPVQPAIIQRYSMDPNSDMYGGEVS